VTVALVLQSLCRQAIAGNRRLRAADCSNPEQRDGTLAQGKPSAAGCCRDAARWYICASLAWLPALAGAACADAPVASLPALERVAAGVWRVPAARGEPDAANGGATIQLVLVRDGARLWLIGSGPTPAFGAALACAIERGTGRAVTDVVNTRAAPELALANAAFPAARLWALPDVAATMRARCGQCLARLQARIGPAGASLRPTLIRVPTRRVGTAGQRAGRLGPFDWLALARAPGERVLVLRLRRPHTMRVVIAQGLLWAGDLPDLRDTRSDTFAASLRRLRTFGAGALLLGEQGGPSGVATLTNHLAYLAALHAAIVPQLAHGDAAAAQAPLPAFMHWPGYAATHPLNVQRVWRELEPTLFR